MKNLPHFFLKMSHFLCLLCCFLPAWISAQQSPLPAIIALNRQVGFIVDSAELKEHNFFGIVPRDSFSYQAIIQREASTYEVVNVFKNGKREVAKISADQLRIEWQKVRDSSVDTTRIIDYDTAKILFPKAKSFIELDSTFNLVPYYYETANSRNQGRFFAELSGKYVSILDGVGMGAFQLDVSGTINKFIGSVKWNVGATYKNEVLGTYVNTGDELLYKYRELSLTGGYVFTNKSVLLSLSTGISLLRYRIFQKRQTSNTLFFPTSYSETEIENTDQIGFPLCVDFSFPTRTSLGLSLKGQATFIPNGKIYYSIGGGFRLGRTKHKR